MEVKIEVEVVGGGMKQEVFCKARNFFWEFCASAERCPEVSVMVEIRVYSKW